MGVRMSGPRTAARVAAAVVAIVFAAPTVSMAENNPTPTYVGMTVQDVGVMDRARPAYDAKGIPLGGFRLFPTLDADGNYDDNVFRTPAALSDWFFVISPTLRLKSQWGRHFFEIYGGANYYNYVTYTDENLTDWKVGSDGRIDISRAASFDANVSYGQQHELWSAPNNVGFQASPNRYFQTHADARAAYQPNRLGIALGGVFDRNDWTDTPKIGGGFLDNDDRDQDEYQGYVKVFYDFSPGYSGFLKATFDERQFDQFYDRSGLHRSSHGYRVDGGLNLQIAHLVRGEIFLGYLQQSFSQNVPHPLQNLSGFDYGAQLDWFLSPILTAHLTGSRTLSDLVLDGASLADNKNIGISADYEFRPNIILQARASYTESRYIGTSRTDRYPGAGVGIKYLVNSYVTANLDYNYSSRSTDAVGATYKDSTVSFGLTLHV
jgi:hypothetical protein